MERETGVQPLGQVMQHGASRVQFATKRESETMEFTSRYGDGPLPDPETMCTGECEGTGWVPVYFPEGDHRGFDAPRAVVTPSEQDYERYRAAWLAAERKQATDDGWHFVPCLECGGSGKRI